MTTRTTRSKARVPSSSRLLTSLGGRTQDDGGQIDKAGFLADAKDGQGKKSRRPTVDGVLAAAKKYGCAEQAYDILLDACGMLQDRATTVVEEQPTRRAAEGDEQDEERPAEPEPGEGAEAEDSADADETAADEQNEGDGAGDEQEAARV